MHPVEGRGRVQPHDVAILMVAVLAAAALGMSSSSCYFDTKTTACEGFNLRCRPGQVCAPSGGGAFECVDRGGCGDGERSAVEACDDGNLIDGDGCDSNCTKTECGNGIATAGEECDSGKEDTIGCNHDCTLSRCGDGYWNEKAGEECDSGGVVDADCNGTVCTRPKCGDYLLNEASGEACDVGGNSSECNGNDSDNDGTPDHGSSSCQPARCGDGYHNPEAENSDGQPEQCDGGMEPSETCNGNNGGQGSCRKPACGDGYANPMSKNDADEFEECDGGMEPSETCNGNNGGRGSCRKPACGDGYTNSAFHPSGAMEPGEACDTGGDTPMCNGNKDSDGDGRSDPGSCQSARCGDGYVNSAFHPFVTGPAEMCDTGGDSEMCNGNDPDGDGVENAGPGNCQMSGCEDGYWNELDEQCDVVDGVSRGCPTGSCNSDCECA